MAVPIIWILAISFPLPSSNKDYGIPARLYALQARVNLEYHLTERFGIFLTGGYGGSRYYTQGKTYDKGIIVEGGVTILKL